MAVNPKYEAYKSALTDMLFLNIYSAKIKSIRPVMRCVLYGAALLFFYTPVILGAATLWRYSREYIPYLICFAVLHTLSKLLFHYTKMTQYRFADAKKKRRFFFRIVLVVEYIVLMWLVYLFYPITCILFPAVMMVLFCENVIGFSFIFNLLITHMGQFIFYGGLTAYVVFLFAGGYKKMMTGLMPAYLRMSIILVAMSGLIDRAARVLTLEHILDDLETFSYAMSQFFTLSNQALNIVSTFVMFAYAAYSLFSTCGLDIDAKEWEPEQTDSE